MTTKSDHALEPESNLRLESILRGLSAEAGHKVSIEGLLDNWRRLIDSINDGYSLTLDDYENDLDSRELLEKIVQAANETDRTRLMAAIAPLDRRFIAATAPNDLIRRREVVNWLSRTPRDPGQEMGEQLAALKSVRNATN